MLKQLLFSALLLWYDNKVKNYTIIRELPAGKGFADIAFITRRIHADKPALLIELKKDRTAGGAIDQIKEKNYPDALKEYSGNLLLCGINYDTKTKEHTTEIVNSAPM